MNNPVANMTEIFSSIQGEGVLVGFRQIFLRFQGCLLQCDYCDTPALADSEFCSVEDSPGKQVFSDIKNPIALEYLLHLLRTWTSQLPHAHHSISLTGGEPLLHSEFLTSFLPEACNILPIYLETNGILCSELANHIESIDYISMDFKLPSTTRLRNFWKEHEQFLEIAAQSNVYVKAVVSDETPCSEIRKASEIIAAVNADIPLILQPLTPPAGMERASSAFLLTLQEAACDLLKEVRVIPQTHKYMHLF